MRLDECSFPKIVLRSMSPSRGCFAPSPCFDRPLGLPGLYTQPPSPLVAICGGCQKGEEKGEDGEDDDDDDEKFCFSKKKKNLVFLIFWHQKLSVPISPAGLFTVHCSLFQRVLSIPACLP